MIETNKIYCGNCAEIMKGLDDNSIDLTVTSPPYDNLRIYNGYIFCFQAIARELFRVTKKGGVVVWVVGDQTIKGSESGTSAEQKLFFNKIGFNIHDTMIYMKSGPSYPSKDKYYQVFEYMFILSKGKPKTFNPIKDRINRWYGQKWSKVRTRRQQDGSIKRQIWDISEGDKLGVRFNIWQYAVGAGNHGDEFAHKHPASFPEGLAHDHIISWSNAGDLVLDPMCGSGTTCKEAMLLKRNYIGMDCSEEYVKLSEERIRIVAAQTRLF